MKQAFTPGPWQITSSNFDIKNAVGIKSLRDDGWVVADVWRDEEEIPWEANARLIAAAPDLYEALATMVEDAEKAANPAARLFNYAAAKAALAKAVQP